MTKSSGLSVFFLLLSCLKREIKMVKIFYEFGVLHGVIL